MLTDENLLVGSTVWLETSGPMRVHAIEGGFATLVSVADAGVCMSIGTELLLKHAVRIDPPPPADLAHLPAAMDAGHREIEHDDVL